ncbi:MAG: glycoside hydrolase family 2 protein [Promethearchaeota archaeon]
MNGKKVIFTSGRKWMLKRDQILTTWATGVNPEVPHPEYPRPQFRRGAWLNLNGLWDYCITGLKVEKPGDYDGKILVPFCIESALSGVRKRLKANEYLWYRRFLDIPREWREGREVPAGSCPPGETRILLHFGAVDWETVVIINGVVAGVHEGGYSPFSIDITGFLEDVRDDSPEKDELVIRCRDKTDKGKKERGKQKNRPFGIFYTPTSGIWQTVWLEPVNSSRIKNIHSTPVLDKNTLECRCEIVHPISNHLLKVAVVNGQDILSELEILLDGVITTYDFSLEIENIRPWSPDDPFLYDLVLDLMGEDEIIDHVTSYFGMRSVGLGKDDHGNTRILLNGKPLFQHGLLDQGYWPGGLLTPPADEALIYDVELAKRLGFNMLRKHVKVEIDRWYYHCDRLGVLVWQDMVCGGNYITGTLRNMFFLAGLKRKKDFTPKKDRGSNFMRELESMMGFLHNHPSIVVWVPFNESWGQSRFSTRDVVSRMRELDGSRLINEASGSTYFGFGDIKDVHVYPGPGMPSRDEGECKALVLGEYGGYGLEMDGHVWDTRFKWGYRKTRDESKLNEKLESSFKKLKALAGDGLSAAVYTQLSDVEGEVNGLVTYDREVVKVDLELIKALNESITRLD